jgi:competence protein ComEC
MSGRRPLMPLVLGLAAGISLTPVLHWPAASAFAALLSLSPPLTPLALFCAGLGAPRPSAPAASEPVELEVQGHVASVPERRADRVRFLLRTTAGRLFEISAPEPVWPLAWGDRIRLSAELRSFPGARNPGGWNRAARAAAHGIELEGYSRLPPARIAPPSPLAHLEAARLRFSVAAEQSMPPRESALVRALGAGDTSAIAPETLDAFARSGLAHLLSVSGLHLAVVAFGLFRLMRWLLIRWDLVALRVDPRRWAALLTLPITCLYALGTGAQVPVVRSAIVASVAFLGVILDREGELFNTLALAALAILTVEPGALHDPSFQLSFASIGGLALMTAPLRRALPVARRLGRLGRLREVVLTSICASLAATLATAPIVAFHFRRISLLAVPANLVGIPIGSGLTVLATLAALSTSALPPLGALLLRLCAPLAALLLWVNDIFASPRWGTMSVASPGLVGLGGCLVLAGVSLRARRASLRLAALTGALAALLLPGPLRWLSARQRGGLEVVFLSVGQGDSAILRLPDGSGVLIDAGGDPTGRFDPGARDVAPFLNDMGVRRLAAAFVSHPHADHLLGLPAVYASLPIEELFSNGRAGDEASHAAWARLPLARALSAGDVREISGVRFEVLAPQAGSVGLGENDASLVLRVVYGETIFLFPGDVEAQGIDALLGSGRALGADVLKVPHHGSRNGTSPAFANATRPRWAVITVAPHNRFGLPNREVVERWRAVGAEVLKTSDGAARFFSDGCTVRRTEPGHAIDAWALWQERSTSPVRLTAGGPCVVRSGSGTPPTEWR